MAFDISETAVKDSDVKELKTMIAEAKDATEQEPEVVQTEKSTGVIGGELQCQKSEKQIDYWGRM